MKKKSFTLVEIMIVVAIIAILAAIAVPALNANRQSAMKQTMAANIKAIDGAIANYLANNPDKTRSDITSFGAIKVYLDPSKQSITNFKINGKSLTVDSTTVHY